MTPMTDDEFREQVGHAYSALGRHVVKFSLLIAEMRQLSARRLAGGDEQQDHAEVLFGKAPAGDISDGFFGLCQLVGDFNDADQVIATALKIRVESAISFRNRVAHADWLIGIEREAGADRVEHPEYRLLKRMDKHGAFRDKAKLTVEEIDKKTDRLVDLLNATEEFGRIALGLMVLVVDERGKVSRPTERYRVSDIFVAEGPRQDADVLREGSRAAELFRFRFGYA
jgi:hypothetical protein